MSRRAAVLLSVGVVSFLAWTLPASGQQTSSWQIAPRAGVFLPMSALGNVPISTQIENAAPEAREAKLEAGASVGMSFLRETLPGTRLRLDVDYVPPVDVRVDGYSGTMVQASVASVMAGIEMALAREPGLLQPYATFGAGVRAYRFQPGLSAGPQFPADQLSGAARVGGGVVLRVSVASIGAEFTDQLSLFRFDKNGGQHLMNDLHGLLSIRVGLF